MTHEDDLRAWAKGSHTLEAATELLLRAFEGRFAAIGYPWVHAAGTSPEGYKEKAWIDFEALGEDAKSGAYSGGESRFLQLAASLGADIPVVLGDTLPGLDRKQLDLVLAAFAHAGGSHQHSDIRFSEDGIPTLHPGYLDTLHAWPRSLRAV